MRYLLDAHTFLWWTTDDKAGRLSKRVYSLLENRENTLFLSLTTIWEIQIKLQLGRLNLPSPLPEILDKHQTVNQLILFPINLAHILALSNLPNHHGDPFDRLLIAQSTVEGIPILSKDAVLTQYPVTVIW